ncbi:phospholipase A and acyltransferase 3-like isoform X2 [Varanus komodoensis]|uniref:phospholipase A and acyltransferase 3-like isoform X2 n=1 Tax=Varanus komodoensis TaxID=61221 RepID=UPI001CF79F4A|nr:phospholipase A and acyltransferase 3-like isoform X2 [Varanus komodoensis]
MPDRLYVEPKPGDLIEISRLGYQHWAIYVGSGYVIHLTPSGELKQSRLSSFLSIVSDKMVVKKALLWEIARGDVCQVNNKYDRKHRPRPARKIVREAELLLGKEMHYSLTSSNCEHFATRLRYGMARSDQVSLVVAFHLNFMSFLFDNKKGLMQIVIRN